MFKLDRNSVIGILALSIFVIYGTVGVSGGVFKHTVFAFLHLSVAVLTFVLITYVFANNKKDANHHNLFWCDFAPFSVILIVAGNVAGWDFCIVFYFIGMVYLALNEVFRLSEDVKGDIAIGDLCRPAVVCLGSAVVYLVLSVVGGTTV